MQRVGSKEDYERLKEKLKARSAKRFISVCNGAVCESLKGRSIALALEKVLEEKGLKGEIGVKLTGCHGMCSFGPSVIIYPDEICYLRVKESHAPLIVEKTILRGELVEDLLYSGNDGSRLVYLSEIPFYRMQKRLIMGHNPLIDPTSIEDYISTGGYSALVKALFEMSPADVLEEIKRAKLRGRGGGGFPTGVKWETTRNAKGDVKYVIVNGHEGEPGAYMDRAILCGNPHLVLEGLIIGAYAIGAKRGFIYLRHDYPEMLRHVQKAVKDAREYGFLGEGILGKDLSFDVEIHLDLGIFVSGESSALMRSIEGRPPEPRPKYIRTSISGVYERPSNLNNVETWANVPIIVREGSNWYSKIGTENSKGTKLISLSGRVRNQGVIEVPFGTTLREIVYGIGGGIEDGKELKAMHFGSAMGGSLPKDLLDLPLDFDECAKMGAPIGAGGLLVLDERDDMVELLSYFVEFLSNESCGKCVPCREGLRQLKAIIKRFREGTASHRDFDIMREILDVQEKASLCALGRSIKNPFSSALKYFPQDFEKRVIGE